MPGGEDEGYAVAPDRLTAHAATVDNATSEVSQARAAAAAVQLDSGAYGHLLQWLPPVVWLPQEIAIAALADAERVLREAGHDLRKAARDYRDADTAAADSYALGRSR
jgi:beta-glucosidase-like glycosyl hydrolase